MTTTWHDSTPRDFANDLQSRFNSDDSAVADMTAYVIGVDLYATIQAIHTPADRRNLAREADAALARTHLALHEELFAKADAEQLRAVMRGIAQSIRAYADRTPRPSLNL